MSYDSESQLCLIVYTLFNNHVTVDFNQINILKEKREIGEDRQSNFGNQRKYTLFI